MGVWAVDLLGRGGIVVNGASVRFQRIADGDELQIGPVRIRFRCNSTAGNVRGDLEGGVASGSRGLPSVDRPRPQVLVSPRPVTGRAVGWRVSESEAGMPGFAGSPLVHPANLFDPMQHQEQMFDQFQQVMTMIVQRFGDRHRDEMNVVREEITQIRQLNGELQSLHSRLSNPPPDASPVSHPESPPAVSPGLLPAAESRPLDPGPSPRPRAEGRPPLPSERPIEYEASAVSHEEMHGHIRRRMEALERERKSHWQRIIDLMRGPQTGPSGV